MRISNEQALAAGSVRTGQRLGQSADGGMQFGLEAGVEVVWGIAIGGERVFDLGNEVGGGRGSSGRCEAASGFLGCGAFVVALCGR